MVCNVALRALALTSLLFLGACAFGDRQVELVYVPTAGGALPVGKTYEVTVTDFTDSRTNTAYVGKVLNGYGMHTADVLATNSVALWITDAIRLELERAGFTVVPVDEASPDAFNISGEVANVSGDAYFHYKANVAFNATVMRAGEPVLDGRYANRSTGDMNMFASGAGYNEALQESLARVITQFIGELAVAAAEATDAPEISSRGDDRDDRLLPIDAGA
jgi:hypothetical protein